MVGSRLQGAGGSRRAVMQGAPCAYVHIHMVARQSGEQIPAGKSPQLPIRGTGIEVPIVREDGS